MPHVTLEYTGNIRQEIRFRELFARVHEVLVQLGPTRIENCKSRAIRLEHFHVGGGEPRHAFVHAHVRLLQGRSAELKKRIGQQLLALLKEHFAPTLAEFELQITVEMTDLDRQTYAKVPEGTL